MPQGSIYLCLTPMENFQPTKLIKSLARVYDSINIRSLTNNIIPEKVKVQVER